MTGKLTDRDLDAIRRGIYSVLHKARLKHTATHTHALIECLEAAVHEEGEIGFDSQFPEEWATTLPVEESLELTPVGMSKLSMRLLDVLRELPAQPSFADYERTVLAVVSAVNAVMIETGTVIVAGGM